jgi:hypothetical protein
VAEEKATPDLEIDYDTLSAMNFIEEMLSDPETARVISQMLSRPRPRHPLYRFLAGLRDKAERKLVKLAKWLD